MTSEFIEWDNRIAPVCITGMHRSGTSTVAQLLYRCGLYLGDEKDLFAAGPANPDGFWENQHFVNINEQILRMYAGGWDLPPSLPPDYHRGEALQPLRAEAERLLEDFRNREPWGWKDPRSSLTLPFWFDLLPDMRVVVCLRNPLEVAFSLRKRGNSSLVFGLNLWKTYNQTLLDNLSEEQYVVTHYESYFTRPQAELRRVLAFLNIPVSDQLISLVRSRVIKGLRHHFVTMEDLQKSDPSGETRDLYLQMCEKADWDIEPDSSHKLLVAEVLGRINE